MHIKHELVVYKITLDYRDRKYYIIYTEKSDDSVDINGLNIITG